MDGLHRVTPERVESSSAFVTDVQCLAPILTLEEVAAYFDRKPNTIYEWKAKGLLDEACRKRGKHLFFWRDNVIELKLNLTELKQYEPK